MPSAQSYSPEADAQLAYINPNLRLNGHIVQLLSHLLLGHNIHNRLLILPGHIVDNMLNRIIISHPLLDRHGDILDKLALLVIDVVALVGDVLELTVALLDAHCGLGRLDCDARLDGRCCEELF